MDSLYVITLMVAIAAAVTGILTGVLHLIRTGGHLQSGARLWKALLSNRLADGALVLGVVSLTVSIIVHSRWGHGPGTVAPMGFGRLLSEHEAFPTVGAMLLLGLGLLLFGGRRQRKGGVTLRSMHPELQSAFQAEMRGAAQARAQGDLDAAFAHLERAHVLGQWYVGTHTRAHVGMLRIGWHRRDAREILGQLLRIPGGIIGSALGRVPRGNTGGANVSAFREMPIAPELRDLLLLDSRSRLG